MYVTYDKGRMYYKCNKCGKMYSSKHGFSGLAERFCLACREKRTKTKTSEDT